MTTSTVRKWLWACAGRLVVPADCRLCNGNRVVEVVLWRILCVVQRSAGSLVSRLIVQIVAYTVLLTVMHSERLV